MDLLIKNIKKILHIIISFNFILFLSSCDKENYLNYNHLNNGCDDPLNTEVDITGSCCTFQEIDCNDVCNGNSILDLCNQCDGDNTTCDLNSCNNPDAINYNPGSEADTNCIICSPNCDSNYDGWTWVWGDEFNDNTLDLSKWDYQFGTGSQYGLYDWGNNEEQYYTSNENNISIQSCDNDKSCLVITALREQYETKDYTSARIKSAGSGYKKYGRIDIRAKLPSAQGTWPAFWMLPKPPDIGWPHSGEIDIMEHVGCDLNSIYGSAHCSEGYGSDAFTNNPQSKIIDDVTEFHIYRVDWDSNAIKWYVDDQLYHTYMPENQSSDNWPFNEEFYIILNLAVGGTWGGSCGDIDYNEFTNGQSIIIDYVRYFQETD